MIDLDRIASPSAESAGQYDPTECWADRRTPQGQVIGSCVWRGYVGLLGLCSTHYGEIIGWPA